LLLKLLKKQGLIPKRITTDKLRSYRAAKRHVMPGVEHRSHKGLNNRAENSHLTLRKRERMIQGFGLVGGLQRFVSLFSAVRNLFPNTPETPSPHHSHSPHPRHGAVKCRDRRTGLISIDKDRSIVSGAT
jgi:putative transposase